MNELWQIGEARMHDLRQASLISTNYS